MVVEQKIIDGKTPPAVKDTSKEQGVKKIAI